MFRRQAFTKHTLFNQKTTTIKRPVRIKITTFVIYGRFPSRKKNIYIYLLHYKKEGILLHIELNRKNLFICNDFMRKEKKDIQACTKYSFELLVKINVGIKYLLVKVGLL